MTSGMKTIIYPVTDIARAKRLYGTLLGVAPEMDESYYVQFSAAGVLARRRHQQDSRRATRRGRRDPAGGS